ncbi:MAG TPA: inositol monophosphatase family protein [Gaiellaceae bacterium]|nr:inositol monophosphatase family protein [Gaiellaceae bacterium]
MTEPWLELCRAAAADVQEVLVRMPTRAERERVVGRGKGGDETAALDEAAETATLRHFEGEDVRIVSEEIGFRGEGRYTVVVDPIDGSQNAERGIPFFCLSVAVADGDTIDDVFFGYVYDFGAGEEWTAWRGEGAFLNEQPLTTGPKDFIEFLSIEATRAALVHERLRVLAPLTDRVRVMGAQAITYCHLAAGRTDAMAVLRPTRAVDFAAGQLLIRERGFAIALPDGPELGEHPLDLESRSRVVAAGNEELCARLATALLTD